MALGAGLGGQVEVAREAHRLGYRRFEDMYRVAQEAGHWEVAALGLQLGASPQLLWIDRDMRPPLGRKGAVTYVLCKDSRFECLIEPDTNWAWAHLFARTKWGWGAAMWSGVMILLCDDYLKIKKYLVSTNPAFVHHGANRAARFFGLAVRLPIELQMVLGFRAIGFPGTHMIWDIIKCGMMCMLVVLKG